MDADDSKMLHELTRRFLRRSTDRLREAKDKLENICGSLDEESRVKEETDEESSFKEEAEQEGKEADEEVLSISSAESGTKEKADEEDEKQEGEKADGGGPSQKKPRSKARPEADGGSLAPTSKKMPKRKTASLPPQYFRLNLQTKADSKKTRSTWTRGWKQEDRPQEDEEQEAKKSRLTRTPPWRAAERESWEDRPQERAEPESWGEEPSTIKHRPGYPKFGGTVVLPAMKRRR